MTAEGWRIKWASGGTRLVSIVRRRTIAPYGLVTEEALVRVWLPKRRAWGHPRWVLADRLVRIEDHAIDP